MSKEITLGRAWAAVNEPPRELELLGGMVRIVSKWETDRLPLGNKLVNTPVLNSYLYLQESAEWPLAKDTLNRLKQAVTDNPKFSALFPAIGYFTIIYEVEPLEGINLDLRMSHFYSSLVYLQNTPPELKGIMSSGVCTVLLEELRRGTMQPNFLFGLEASGELGSKSMLGLVNYYRNSFGLQVARPDQIEQDIERAGVVMVAPVSEVANICTQKLQKTMQQTQLEQIVGEFTPLDAVEIQYQADQVLEQAVVQYLGGLRLPVLIQQIKKSNLPQDAKQETIGRLRKIVQNKSAMRTLRNQDIFSGTDPNELADYLRTVIEF